VSIAYSVMGAGPPLIFPPGIFYSLAFHSKVPLFSAFFSELSQTHQVLLYDSRGFGLSQRDAAPRSLDAHVSDLAAVVDAAGSPQVAIFATTLLGPTALAYAASHKDRVSHLILFGTFARGADVTTREQATAIAELCRTNWELASQVISDMSIREEFAAEGIVLAREWRANVRGEALANELDRGYDDDVTGLLPDIQAATLVLHRRDDEVIPFSAGQRLAAMIRGARFVPLEGRANTFVVGDTRSILNAMRSFLRDNTQTAVPATSSPGGGTRTILVTDLVGHTEMMRRLGDDRGREVLREHERITRELLKEYAGAEVKTMGDGFMASFASVTKAMECAIALQRAFAKHEGEPLAVRVGLNAGEPIEEDGDLFGATVILASRIAGKARAGEILVPDTVRGLLSGKGFVFGDRGETMLKGFDDAVRLYEVRWRE
jgi:class 3 adenylate cyclase